MRLIDADALMENTQIYEIECGDEIADDVREIKAVLAGRIEKAPTIDPVKRGHWIDDDGPQYYTDIPGRNALYVANERTNEVTFAPPAAREWTEAMTTEDRTRAIAWFEKQAKCLAMPGAAKMFGLAAEALKEGRWVAVSERLPEYTDDYNVVCNIGSMLGGYTDVRTYRFECIQGREPRWCIPSKFDEVVVVTHWMPFPDPPRKDDEV